MKNNFTHQTGAMSFNLSLSAESTNGTAEINFGQEGISGAAISFYLKSGEIYDRDGAYFGSYLPREICNVRGVRVNGLCSYYYNDLLVKTNYSVANMDINNIEIVKTTDGGGPYVLSHVVNGISLDIDKNLLYISESGSFENDTVEMIRGMSLFSGSFGISIGYGDYTGELSSEKIASISNYDLVVFGQGLSTGHFVDKSGWAMIETPIVFLNSEVANQDCLGIISGSIFNSNGEEMNWGENDESILDSKLDIYRSFLRRGETGEQSRYALYTGIGQKFISYGSGVAESEKILYNGEIGMIDVIWSGTSGYSGALPQNGNRIFFNAPCQSAVSLFNESTENWKKIFSACVYDCAEMLR